MHRLTKPIHLFTAPAPSEGGNSGEGGNGDGSGAGDGQSFTQADVDRIVTERLKRERETTKAKYADYDDLKARAEGAKTLEDRLADLETKGTEAEQRALRAEIASEFSISTKRGEKGEPSDADLFLTATDEDGLRKQAERLAGRESDRKKTGNHVPREGQTSPAPAVDGKRAWLRSLKQQD
jgi:hypothetical protein